MHGGFSALRISIEGTPDTAGSLEEAFAAGELPLVDFQSLAVLLDGVFWQLMVEFSRTGAALDFTRIPDLIDEFVLTPLQGRLEERITKEGTTT